MEFFASPIFSLFFIVAIGFILGNIQFKGFSFDVSAILFLALFMGYLGIQLPIEFQTLGLVLFIYTIGVQAGPGFFESFKKQGRIYALLAVIIVVSGAIVTVAAGKIFHIDKNLCAGLLTGALTSTPGLAVAIDATQSPLASIGYGIAYPFGVIGVILFIKLMPKLMNTNIRDIEKAMEENRKKENPEILVRNYIVTNPKAVGKTLTELKVRQLTGAVISRVKQGEITITPTPLTVLKLGDKLRVVGQQDSFPLIETLLGNQIDEEIELSKEYRVQSVLVTSNEVINKTLQQINLFQVYHATVTRIRRSGIDLPPNPQTRLQLGDKLMVACSKENMKNVTSLFGDNDKRLSDTDFFPIAVGIVLGILAGKLSLSFGANFTFSLGLTGGVLMVALVLGRVGKTGKVLWSMTGAATQLLKQLGLLFFLASVGTQAGSVLVEAIATQGIKLFFVGALITVIPMVATLLMGKYYLKLNVLELFGAISGGMTSTPGLAAVEPMTDSDVPKIAYATIYPIAMVLLILVVQFII